MNELALFAGGGGGLLATKWMLQWKTICYVENNPYCVKVLKARIRDGYLDDAPIWGDVKTFDGAPWRGVVDCITAGFPCQPFSQAGKGLAERDDRNLWPDTIRVVREVRPRWVLLENVSRLLSHAYIQRIFADLAEGGYDCRWDCIPASAVGANHQRDRIWIVAHANERLGERTQEKVRPRRLVAELCSENVAHTNSGRLQEHPQLHGETQQDPPDRNPCGRHAGRCSNKMANANRQPTQRITKPRQERNPWFVEPQLGRVAYGVAHRVDRLATIGEGQVPAVVATVWPLLTEEENATQAHP